MRTRQLICAGMAALMGIAGSAGAQQDLFEKAPWNVSFGLGGITYEGDEEVKDAPYGYLRLGYNFNPRWAVEVELDYMPHLEAREFPAEPERFALEDDTDAVRIAADVLFHLRNIEDLRFDPYLSAGVGLIRYGDELDSGQTEEMFTGGAGMFYHFDDEWALRADVRGILAGPDTEANFMFGAGVNWRWGARVPVEYAVSGGDVDSDGDGLLDNREAELGTDPFNPDTDGDELQDGAEVNLHDTDPLDPDTDLDALQDGAEVLTYETNPLERDTDQGGVADGHEVIEDNTDPLDPSDDLQLFTLQIEFDTDKAVIKEQYFDELDAVVKVLQRDEGAHARIEGHADKRKTSDRDYNIKLSERRAKAVAEYIAEVGGISMDRLEWVGYGFDRPLVPNTSPENMQKNRRVEIYIQDGE